MSTSMALRAWIELVNLQPEDHLIKRKLFAGAHLSCQEVSAQALG